MSNESQPAEATAAVRPAIAWEVSSAVALLLADGQRPAAPAQVAEFIHFAGKRHLDLSRIWVAAEAGGRILAAVLPAISPGHSMLLITGPQTGEAMRKLIDAVCDHYGGLDVHLAQSLLDPGNVGLRDVFAAARFVRIAELIYLQADVPRHTPKQAAEQLPPGMRWETYSPQMHGVFGKTILRTYEKSLDCPVITGLRDIEDVIIGHKGAGEFVPELWQILMEGERGLGVMLLNRILHADAMELVYLGIAPEARGRGIGQAMMRHAQRLALADQRRRITLAVDSVNVPALRLYDRFGFRRFAAKIVMLRDLRKRLITRFFHGLYTRPIKTLVEG